jgi:superfamily I DNA and/or RNA helicase
MTLTAAVSAFCAASDEKLDSFKLRRDVLIIEEAGQVPLPLGACAGHLAASVLMFGDQGQLGAIYSFDEADDPLAISLFARFHLVQPGAIAFLPQTERLNTQLANIVGTTWYASSTGASRLSPTETAATGRLAYRATNDTWANEVLDPAHALTWVACDANDTRTHCAAEAAQAARLIGALRTGGVKQVMVVSPYRQQVREIQNALAETNAPDVVVDTIERAQGRTVDAVIVSFAASERDYLKDNRFFFSDQRWNVAFSRARHKVVVLGSPEVRRTAHNCPVARQAQIRLGRVLEQAHRVNPPDSAEGPAGTR